MDMATIEPTLPGGFKDYLPEDMIPRQKMLDTIRKTFELFGFVPLDTPGIEKTEILTGGDPEFKKQIYRIASEKGDDELALRFDLTVPLARVVAANAGTIRRPFKRYQMGKVWRGERQQAGRFREFMQCDADIVGTESVAADAEIIALINTVMRALGFKRFLIKINNRKILNCLAEYAKFDDKKLPAILRSLDKLDKQEWSDVEKELIEIGITPEAINAIKNFINVKESKSRAKLTALRELLVGIKDAEEGIKELEVIASYLDALGVSEESWTFDFSVARGLGYYTGPVFETTLLDLPKIGSVFSGGRYDDLVARFGTITIPATGASIGIDRLFAAMEKLNLIKQEKTTAQVIVLNFDESCATSTSYTVATLRSANIPAELYFGSEKNMKGQLAYAVNEEIPVTIIIGGNEKEKGTAMVKDMRKRTQIEVPQKEIVQKIKEILQ
jgi:histidyl-tRNA synthetase